MIPLALVLDELAEGVIVLDRDLRPMIVNRAARGLLGLEEKGVPPRLPSDELMRVAHSALEGDQGEQIVSLWFPLRRTLNVKAMSIGTERHVVMSLQDVTQEQLTQLVRREFVAHASHELKTPIAGVQAISEAIRKSIQDDDAEASLRFADKLIVEAERLGRLVGDLLDLSRLEEAADVPREAVDISELVALECAEIRREAELHGITISTPRETHVFVLGDRAQLQGLVRNLLENAVRYSQDDGTIEVQVTRDSEFLHLTVADSGIGIPVEAQGRVFERFFRVDRARSRDRGGTGLGLAIVKHVAEQHGGRVAVESELGSGSTFSVWLPLYRTEPVAPSGAA